MNKQFSKALRWTRLMIVGTAACCGLVATPGFAQEQTGETDTRVVLEEISVTAQRRVESLQEVPIAVSAFTGEELEIKGITSVQQVAEYSANVYMDPTVPFGAGNNVLAAYVRGIGQQDFAFNLEPGVAVYVDGVYLARTIGANFDLLDVERLEVLKGPQGTLFGRNTIGGAIHVITRRPAEEFKYEAEATLGSYDRLDVRGLLEGPLVAGKVYGQLAFSSKDRDGYQTRIPFPGISTDGGNDQISQFLHTAYDTSETQGGENQQNVRGKLLFEVSEALEVTLTGNWSHTDEESVANSMLKYYANPAPGANFTFLGDLCASLPLEVLHAIPLPPCFLNRGIKDALPSVGAPYWQQPPIGGANADADPFNNRTYYGFGFQPGAYGSPFILDDPDLTYANGISFNKLDIFDVYAHVDYDFANEWHLKSITSYRDLDWQAGVDADASPLNHLEVSFSTFQEQWSQEFQLNGEAWDNRWNWLVGLYYFHEEGDLTDYVTFPHGLLQIYGENEFDTDAWAVFTHNNIAVTDRIGITIGVRYTDEDRDFEGRQRDLNMIAVNPFLPPGTGCPHPAVGCSLDAWPDQNDFTRYYPLGVNNKTFDDTSFKLGAEYSFTEDVMGYVSFSQGFKGGGWTTRLSTPHTSIEPTEFQSLSLDFDEETADTWELGLKTELLDNTLRLNSAVFYTKYDNIQITKQDGPSPVFDTAGDGEITGFEVEALWQPTDNLQVQGSVGYLDAEYTNIDEGVFITLLEDTPDTPRTPLSSDYAWVNVPEWDTFLGATYYVPLASGAQIRLVGEWTHTSEIANDTSNTPELMQGNVDFFNASIAYTAAGGNWEVTFGGRNITDERHIVTGQIQPAAGFIYGTWNRPDEWYLTFRFRSD